MPGAQPPHQPRPYGRFGSLTYRGRHRAKGSRLPPPLAVLVAAIFVLGALAGIALAPGRTRQPASLAENRDRIRELVELTESLEEGLLELGRQTSANTQRIDELERRLDRAADARPSGQAATGEEAESETDSGESPAEDNDAQAGSILIAEFSGTGPQTTPEFASNGPWIIRWQGRDIFFFIKRPNGDLVHGDGGSGTGTYRVTESGRFYLDVLGRGAWNVRMTRS